MLLGRAVPWTSWEEWRQVGLWLLSEAPGDVQQGLDRVAAWRTRGRVPLGVDSTACLVEAQLRDRAATAPALTGAAGAAPSCSGSSESELRLQYAMAVVRMVNGIADSAQRGRVAASVASLAAAAGLPRILVDLRHEATHNELPSLAALRLAAQHGLAWLQGNYWQRQSDHVHASADKVRALEYLELHLAAATKVAASAAAAGDSDDSDEEDVRPSAAVAAAAAAASVSAGRKAAGRTASMPDAAAAAAGGGTAAAGGYQAADAKKRRRQLLSEIRSAVPRPAAVLVADALLAASAAQAAAGAGACEAGSSSGGGNVAAPASAAVVERALAATLGHLTALYPQLPPLLLLGVVRRLAAAAAEPGNGSSPDAAVLAGHLRWLQRLLPGQSQQQQQQGGSSSMLAAAKGWAPSAALLRQLLGEALPAQAGAAQRAAWQAVAKSSGGGADGRAGSGAGGLAAASTEGSAGSSASGVAEVLQQAVALLLAAVGQSPTGKAAASLAALVPGAVAAGTAAAGEAAAAAPEGQLAAQLEAAASNQRLLLARLQQQELQQGRRQQPAVGAPHGSEAGAAEQPPRKRWRRADGWQPCALGMLPCSADPNGRLPPLDLTTLLDLPARFVAHRATEAAAAAAAASAKTQSTRAGQPRGGYHSAAAALLQELQEGQEDLGAWPAADRFAAAAAWADARGDEAAEGWEAAPRVQLPQQAALLV
ncbi:hypothetical protein ABPG75_001866 [Micractinium tetrahymenae]